jgi:hypothetical protein
VRSVIVRPAKEEVRMRSSWLSSSIYAASILAVGVGLASCEEPPPPSHYPVTFTAESDPGQALAGVALTIAGAPQGQTGADGTLRIELTGDEGTAVPVAATCPTGYREPAPLSPIVLRTTVSVAGAAAPGLRVTITCLPASRRGVVVVRAGGTGVAPRAGLPVMIEGREVARTDTSGVAHVSLDMAPGQSFQVLLATATASPMLRPQDPQFTFVFPDSDEIFVFDQSFEEEIPPPPPRRHGPRHHVEAAPTGPVFVRPVQIPPTR